jgi:hypothetical protein
MFLVVLYTAKAYDLLLAGAERIGTATTELQDSILQEVLCERNKRTAWHRASRRTSAL